jgi:2-oxoglutarate dehydrogenase E1 component
VSQPTTSSGKGNKGLSGFGPNEWLVDELYQQYLQDKNAVDKAWWDFFEDYKPADQSTLQSNGGESRPAAVDDAPPPEAATTAPAAPTSRADGPRPAPAAPAPAAATPAEPAGKPAEAKPAAPKEDKATDGSAPVPLKGPAARVVTNMQASLAVPTATSVRAVPAKLLIDNRTVINNALQRGRGGKVSFTHLIGHAVVKALASMPEMNYGFVGSTASPRSTSPST